jgi:hypothetical protein
MDLVLGHQCGATCLMAVNYDDLMSAGVEFHKTDCGKIGLLVVLFKHGAKLKAIKESLNDVPQNKCGWFLETPGKILDRVQYFVCPGSIVNVNCQALDHVVPTEPSSLVGQAASTPHKARKKPPLKKPTVDVAEVE